MVAHFTESHAIRKKTLKKLEEYNENWKARHANFMGRLFPDSTQALEPRSDGGGGHLELSGTKGADQNDEATSEFNWEEIVRFDPSCKPKIERFLSSRDTWDAAEEKFISAVDEIQENIQNRHQSILQIIEHAYDQIYDDTIGLQEDIQYRMIDNFHRREGLETHLQEAAEKQQSLFQRLIAKVTGPGIVERKRKKPDGDA